MRHHKFKGAISILAVAVAAAYATSASAWQSPTKKRYMTKPLQICDQGLFYVGGAPKMTPFQLNSDSGNPNRQVIIGQMFVQFQTPMVSKSWPLIMVHGSGYTGSCVQGTAGGTEGWADYTVRHGIPTYVVDQSGRGRSGSDQTPLNEAINLLNQGDTAGALALLPDSVSGKWGTDAWPRWFGAMVPGAPDWDPTTSKMIPYGRPGDPDCPGKPAHCDGPLNRIAMEPEAPWAVDQAIKSRTGNGAPAGLGTITPDNAQVLENASYLALDAYKFDLPNWEAFLPGSTCPTCDPSDINATNTWTPRALAELVEGLGGAIVATHSQSGSIGHHMTRVLKQHGNLDLLKGLITIEGACNVSGAGLAASDFKDIPYMVLISELDDDRVYPGPGDRTECQDSVDAIKAAGGKAEFIKLDQPGWWQGSYAGPFGKEYVGPFTGVSHMMMIESNPGPYSPDGKAGNLQVMDVILKWADENISKPETTTCGQDDGSDPAPDRRATNLR
jgi:hypothetical protein